MMLLVIGGSGCGKSAYAEKCAAEISSQDKFYLATMQVYGEEGLKKVKRHHELRRGKGFETIERGTDVNLALSEIKGSCPVVLLECMSNLVANEMFKEEKIVSVTEVISKVIKNISELYAGVKDLIIVSNNVFDDGISYEETTQDYISAIGAVNCELAKMADKVVEVVVGIPVMVKSGTAG